MNGWTRGIAAMEIRRRQVMERAPVEPEYTTSASTLPYLGPKTAAEWDAAMAALMADDPDTRAMLGIGQRRLVP